MAGPTDDENENDGNELDGATGDKQTANNNHKDPRISEVLPASPLYKFTQDIGQVVKLQATRKSNITTWLKRKFLAIKDNIYQGCHP